MTSGIPLPPEGELQRPLCSSPKEFISYKKWIDHIGFSSEGEIYNELGCLPKCKETDHGCFLNSSFMYRVTKVLGETDYVDIKMRVASRLVY